MPEKITGIILAAGSGSRMRSDVKKQYMEINGKPVIYYTLNVMQKSRVVTDVVIVVTEADIPFCEELVRSEGFTKVSAIVTGGAERYLSVLEGLKAAHGSEYVFIHDGARPVLKESLLEALGEEVIRSGCCALAVPVKDTIRLRSEDGKTECLNRSLLWQMQTPQALNRELFLRAYEKILGTEEEKGITDDVALVEKAFGRNTVLVMGDYRNIKITTPDDIGLARLYLSELEKEE